MVIAGCECGTLYAFDTDTGKTLWQTRPRRPGEGRAGGQRRRRSPTSGDYSGTMSAVNDHRRLDQVAVGLSGRQLRPAGAFYGTAAVAFGRVYAGSARTGASTASTRTPGELGLEPLHRTARSTPGSPRPTPPTPTPTVYFGSYGGGTFYALDARSGNERWSIDAGGPVIGAASVIGEIVYVANLEDDRDRRLQRRQRRQGLQLPRRRLQPGDLGRQAALSDRLQDALRAEAGAEGAGEATA